MREIVIRENQEQYMQELRKWAQDALNTQPEGMCSFFTSRIADYEEHMAFWTEAYDRLTELLPKYAEDILDLGCGTGLDMEAIFKVLPDAYITGIDMNGDMLTALKKKFRNKGIELYCADYFKKILPENSFDVIVAFETLHHFTKERKKGLYEKLYKSLRKGGIFIMVEYIACCEEEEEILFETERKLREKWNVKEEFIHFDTPMTLEHETMLLRMAGFEKVEAVDSIKGATFVISTRE